MKVRAKHNFNDGTYHFGGEVFDTDNIEEIRDFVEVLEEDKSKTDTGDGEFVSEVFPPEGTPKRRGRTKKSE